MLTRLLELARLPGHPGQIGLRRADVFRHVRRRRRRQTARGRLFGFCDTPTLSLRNRQIGETTRLQGEIAGLFSQWRVRFGVVPARPVDHQTIRA